MKTLVTEMFIQNAGSVANGPGTAQNNLQLGFKRLAQNDPNAAVFAGGPDLGGGNLNLNAISADAVAGFTAGQRVRVTLEVIE